jgi:hypothetical protein
MRQADPATCLSVSADCFGQSDRVDYLLLEYRMQKLDDELDWRYIVVMKDDLNVAGVGLNFGHGNYP